MTLNLTLLNDGVASQRLTLPQGKAFRLQAVAGNRYVITQGAEKTAAGPEHLLLKRKGKNLEIRQPGEDEPQLIIVDYYDLPGDVMGLDASGALHEYIHAADASIDADAFTDDQSAVMIMSRSSQGPVSAYSPLGDNGFLKAMAAFAGLLALGGGVLALQNQHSGKESPIPAPTIVQGHDERGDESASLQHGAVTGNAQPDISGQGSAPGNLIHIYSNGECLGSGVVAEDGSWKIKPLAMAEGRHQLTAVESTPQGKISAASVHFELHIDLTPPAVSLDNLADNVGSLTGDIPSGGLTNDTQPWLSGRSEPGAKIEITINGAVVGTAITDADGNWRFRTPVLEEGAQRISVTAMDAVGNTSKPTADYRVEVDTQIAKPTISSITDAVEGGVTGAIANDGTGLTNDARPVLSGKVEAGSLITIYDGSTAIHSFVSTTSTWTWQFPTTGQFSDGEHVLRVKAVDKAGNTSVLSDPFTINVDTQVAQPVISSIVDGVAGGVTGAISNDGTGLTNDNRPVLRGTAEAGSLITIYDGSTAIHSFVSTTSDWTWQYPTTARFSDGEHVLRVQAVDKAGNTSVLSDPFTINVDTEIAQPTISSIVDTVAGGVTGAITNDGTGLTNDNRPVLNGTVEPGSTITIYDGNTPIHSFVVTGSTWTWQYPTTGRFIDGEHVLRVQAVDKAGNTSVLSDPFTINVDTQIAQPTISSIVDAVAGGVTGAITNDGTGLTNDNRPVLSGTVEPGSLITIYDGSTAIHSFVSTTSDWTWQYPTTGRFGDGEHVLRVQAIDKAGNTSVLSDPFTINVDTQIAQPTIASVTDAVAGGVTGAIANDGTGLTNDNRPVLSGTVEPGSLITIYDGSTAIHSFVSTTSDWTWQYPTTGRFIDGEHVLRVQAVDKAGNTSLLSDPFIINVDTEIAQPTISSIVDAVAGGVTGAITNDGTGLTNDNRPVLSGTVEPGSLITIYDGSTAIHSFVSTTSDWTWQYPTTGRFSDGEHVLRVQAIDKAGNTSVLSDPFTINVDTQIAQPTISSIVDAVAGGVTGAITNDGTGLTNDNRPVLNGTVEPGSTITIYDGNTPIHSFVVSGSTWTWQYPTTGRFSDGEHVLRVQAVDKAGNTSVLSDPFTINVDTQVAQPTISSIVDAVAGGVTGAIANDGTGLTNDNRPVLSGTVEPGSLITIYDGTTAIHSFVSSTSDWTWQYPTTGRFIDGEHVLRVQAVDKAGNTSVLSDPFTINVDTEIAQPTITSVVDAVAGGVTGAITNDGTGLTNDNRPVLSGTVEPGSLITIYDGSTAIHSFVSTTSDWTWQYPTTARFSDGEHVLRVQAVDKAGNTSVLSDPFTINVDTEIAQPTISSIIDAVAGGVTGAIANDGTGLTNDNRPLLSGTVEPGSLITIYDGSTAIHSFVSTTSDWTWQYPTTGRFSDGEHVLRVQAVDKAGNTSTLSDPFTINVDTEIAQPTISSLVDAVAGGVTGAITNDGTGLTNDNRPVLSGTVEPGSLITIYDGTTPIHSFVSTTSDWTWQYPTTGRFIDGEHVIRVQAVDKAGNTSVLSDPFTINVDTEIAQPTITSVTDTVAGGVTGALPNDGTGLTNDARPVLRGTTEAGSLITIYDGATAIHSFVSTTSDWTWQYPATERFSDSEHVLRVQAVDKAGNISALSDPFTINVDTSEPVAPVITIGSDNVGALTEAIFKGRITDDTTPTFSGTAEPNSVVYLYDNDNFLGSFRADGTGAWNWTLPELMPGLHNLTAYSRDAAGNKSAISEPYDFKLGTVWDFNDGTFNGWTILGHHARPDDTFVRATAGGGYQLEFITRSTTVDYSGDIMSLQINVQAGETYDFNFILSRITSYTLVNQAVLALTVDGVPVSAYYTVADTPQKVEGSWVATTTGTVTLAINNRTASGHGNDFWIDDIAIALHKEAEPSPAVSSLADAPAIASSDAAHQIDMNEQNLSTLSLNLQDVLSGGESDLFINDGKIQFKVTGEAGRELTLSDLMPDGSDSGEWNSVGNVKVAGVEYQVFQHSNQSAELLVQMGIHTTLDNH